MKVPASGGGGGSAPKEEDPEQALASLDLRRVEDTNVTVCVKCGTELDDGVIECPECGTDQNTGQLSRRLAIKRGIKGPDPSLFYKEVWGDSWQFARGHFGIAMRMTIYWTIMAVMSGACLGLAQYIHMKWGKPPVVMLFAIVGILFYLGIPGWLWFIWIKTIQTTVAKQEEMNRVFFDIFDVMSLGMKFLMWSMVNGVQVGIMTIFITAPIYFAVGQTGANIAGSVINLLSLAVMPVMMSHMAMPFEWKAWVTPILWKITLKNIKPVAFWWLMALVVGLISLVSAAILGVLLAVFGATIVEVLNISGAAGIFPGSAKDMSKTTVYILLGVMLLSFMFSLFISSVGYLFLMRANGQFTFTFKRTLELVTEAKQVKYVSKSIDKDGLPIKKSGKKLQMAKAAGALLAIYISVNVVMHFVTRGEKHLMPKSVAEKIGLEPWD